MARPRIRLRTFLVLVAGASAAAWWLTIQPKRRAVAITVTQRAGGVVQFDQQYRPDWTPKPPSILDITSAADRWLGPGFAHDLSVVNLDGCPIIVFD
jgi:hypothetical protein